MNNYEINNDINIEYIEFNDLKRLDTNSDDHIMILNNHFKDKNDWKEYVNGINFLRCINKYDNLLLEKLIKEFINEIILGLNSIRSFLSKLTLMFLKEYFKNYEIYYDEYIKFLEPILIHKNLNTMKFIKIEANLCYQSLIQNCFSDILINLIINNCDNNLILIRDFSFKNLIWILKNNDLNNLKQETIENLFEKLYELDKTKKYKKLDFINLLKILNNKIEKENILIILKKISIEKECNLKFLENKFININNKDKKEKIPIKNFILNQKVKKLKRNSTFPIKLENLI